MKSLLVLATLAHAGSAFAGACAQPSITATVLTPSTTSLDQFGGVVVGLVSGYGDGEPVDPDLHKLAWKFVEQGKATTPKLTLVAPGLAVLVPDHPGKQLALQAGKVAKVTVTYALRPVRDLPTAAAPNVTGIELTTTVGPRSSESSTDATLKTAVPVGTIAVLVYDPTEQKAGKPARSWAAVTPKAMTIRLAYQARCHTVLAGTRASGVADKVVLVWLDAAGHQSLASTEIEIQ